MRCHGLRRDSLRVQDLDCTNSLISGSGQLKGFIQKVPETDLIHKDPPSSSVYSMQRLLRDTFGQAKLLEKIETFRFVSLLVGCSVSWLPAFLSCYRFQNGPWCYTCLWVIPVSNPLPIFLQVTPNKTHLFKLNFGVVCYEYAFVHIPQECHTTHGDLWTIINPSTWRRR